jgi:hypothetical protein
MRPARSETASRQVLRAAATATYGLYSFPGLRFRPPARPETSPPSRTSRAGWSEQATRRPPRRRISPRRFVDRDRSPAAYLRIQRFCGRAHEQISAHEATRRWHIDCLVGQPRWARLAIASKRPLQGITMNRLQLIARAVAASSLALSVAGCVHGLAPPANPSSIITVDRGYEGVYLALLKDARRCYPVTAGPGQREVNGTLDGPTHSAKVTFSFRSTSAQETFMTADIRSTGPTTTQVEIQAAPGWEPHVKALRGWVYGTSSACA